MSARTVFERSRPGAAGAAHGKELVMNAALQFVRIRTFSRCERSEETSVHLWAGSE